MDEIGRSQRKRGENLAPVEYGARHRLTAFVDGNGGDHGASGCSSGSRGCRRQGAKGGALGFVSSVVVGVASTAPAYSLAATLGFVVIAINGLQAPIITIIAFVPMLCISYGYKALNSADPDCGTTFTWATRAFGPKTRMVGRLGDRRRRHPGHGQPGPDRRPVRLPPLRRQHHRDRTPTAGGCSSSGSCGSSR